MIVIGNTSPPKERGGKGKMNNFESIEQYPFLAPVQEAWREIKSEYEKASQHLQDWPEKYLYTQGWKAFGLYFKDQQMPQGIELCPITWSIIKNIPGLFIAGYSVLKPETKIHPHFGYTTAVLRSHLGLICPAGAWIEVNGEKYEWKEGEMVVFDDTKQHSAANESEEERVIFLLDFRR
jgi:beta-hydroxylase